MFTFYSSEELGLMNCAKPKCFTFQKKQQVDRIGKLKRSISYFCLEDLPFESFSEGWRPTELSELLEDSEKILEVFFSEIEKGVIESLISKIEAGDNSGLREYVKIVQNAQSAWNSIQTAEAVIKQFCVRDWNQYLTIIENQREGETITKYSLIVQAVYNCSPAFILKGPAVSASLITEDFCYPYRDRKIGIVYRLTPENLITISVSDASSHITELKSDNEIVKSLLHTKLIEKSWNVECIEDFNSWFYLYEFFIRKWQKYASSRDPSHRCCEILLKPDFQNDVTEVTIFPNASECERVKAKELSHLFKVPLLEIRGDCTAVFL